MNHKRSIGAALILAFGVTSLTACDVGVSAPVDVAVQAAGTSLRIAICFDTAPVGLKVDERGAGAQGEWTTVWSVAGEARIEAGQVLDESNIPALFGSDAQLDPYLPGKDKEVVVELIYPPGDGSAYAEFDGSKVVEATWLQTNGNATTTPCAT